MSQDQIQSDYQRTNDRRTGGWPPLRAVRIGLGLSLADVAAQADITVSHLSRIETGQRAPSITVLTRLAHVLRLRELERHLQLYDVKPSGRR